MGTWASVCTNPDAENPTWSTPQRLTDGYMRSKPIIVDVDGTTTWMYAAFDWMQPHYTRVYASTDNGATWSLRGKAECIDTTGVNNLDDPVLVQKPDGTLWLLMRPSSGTNVYESFSTDGGYTWTHAKASNIVGPQSRFTIDLLADGKMLMVFHDSTSRNRLTAYLSLDGGETWEYKLLIDERSYVSYPDTIITADGTIYVIYDRNRTTDREVWMTVFTLEDVIAGEYISDEARAFILVDKSR
jgi:outer membrane protein assembly factor BamB